jgi:hypothetical protein
MNSRRQEDLEARVPDADDFARAWDVALTLVAEIANRQKDHADEALDAKRIHDGVTLDEFLGKE